MKIRNLKFTLVIGIGYWKDEYNLDSLILGYCHNIILPFIRIQIGKLRSRCETNYY